MRHRRLHTRPWPAALVAGALAVAGSAVCAGAAVSAGAAGAATPACTARDAIGTVVESAGPAPALGTPVCGGGSLSTGPGGLLTVALNDGGRIRLGASGEIGNLGLGPGGDRLTVGSGVIWGAAPSRHHTFAIALGSGASIGVHGAAFTAGRASASAPLDVHAITGRGFVRYSRRLRIRFLPGYTAIAGPSGVRLTTAWLPVERALVPPAQRPPGIDGVRLLHPRSGPAARLRLALDRPARVIVRLFRGNKVASTFVGDGRPGLDTFAPLRHPLLPGLYVLTVQAVRGGRVSVVRRLVTVR